MTSYISITMPQFDLNSTSNHGVHQLLQIYKASMPMMPTTPARPAPTAVGRAAPPVEEAEALLPLRVPVAEELSEAVLLSSEDEEVELAEEPVVVALEEELPAATLETIEERAEVALPPAVGVAVGAAVMLTPAVAAAKR